MAMADRITAGIARRMAGLRDRAALWHHSRVIHGPARVTLGDTDCAVVTLMKDAEWHIGPFITHHLSRGARHLVVIDNGSRDATAAIAAGFPQVTVVQNPMPAKRHESLLRAGIARQVLRGGWVLFADADEMFEAPLLDGAPDALPRLTAYLARHGYTALVAQMLDLLTDRPYRDTKALDYPASVAAFDRWAMGELTALLYHAGAANPLDWFLRDNLCDDPGVRLLIGGARRSLFGEECHLYKHSLLRNRPGIDLMRHPHCAGRVRVADVTGLLRHYKLAGDWQARDRASVAAGLWDHAEDAKRLAAVTAGDDFTPDLPDARPYRGTADLIGAGFLYASDRYRAEMG
ncbi:glycosyltransferase family 2 protein [Szabonella alba]|uniref:Glycosyltransferase family 2 protein n=1 Tax=Szabonella alba TaxID=2804194 RepID=A0A8K0Y2L2_9RHOB|nr:glycosyltransferase family 2 protein [Szabonella alba]MBL4918079.1 glycosyltransferase family 2 protein [Szabonella alba]